MRESSKCFARPLRLQLPGYPNHLRDLLHTRAKSRCPPVRARRVLPDLCQPARPPHPLQHMPRRRRVCDSHLSLKKKFHPFFNFENYWVVFSSFTKHLKFPLKRIEIWVMGSLRKSLRAASKLPCLIQGLDIQHILQNLFLRPSLAAALGRFKCPANLCGKFHAPPFQHLVDFLVRESEAPH